MITPEELEAFNVKMARLKELEDALEPAFEDAVLNENWEEAARKHNRLNQVSAARMRLINKLI